MSPALYQLSYSGSMQVKDHSFHMLPLFVVNRASTMPRTERAAIHVPLTYTRAIKFRSPQGAHPPGAFGIWGRFLAVTIPQDTRLSQCRPEESNLDLTTELLLFHICVATRDA